MAKSSERFTLFLACLFHGVIIGGGYMSTPPLFPMMAREGWDIGFLQRSWAIISLASIPGALFSAWIASRIGTIGTIAGSAFVASSSLLLRGLSLAPWSFMVLLTLFGLSTGLLLASMTARITRLFSDKHAATAQSAFFGSYALGAAIGVSSAQGLADTFRWQQVPMIWGAVGLSLVMVAENAVARYHSNAITTAEVLQELIEIARQIRAARAKGEETGLSDDEIAFYDALAENDSAVQMLGDDKLKIIAHELLQSLKVNVSVDWARKESARARLRLLVKKILKKYGYPPDLQESAVKIVLQQAESLCSTWDMAA